MTNRIVEILLRGMARFCDKCGRGAMQGVSRSHSNIATKRRLNLNLQQKVVAGLRMRICTSCIKTLNKAAK